VGEGWCGELMVLRHERRHDDGGRKVVAYSLMTGGAAYWKNEWRWWGVGGGARRSSVEETGVLVNFLGPRLVVVRVVVLEEVGARVRFESNQFRSLHRE
jgi:hypothetical protein